MTTGVCLTTLRGDMPKELNEWAEHERNILSQATMLKVRKFYLKEVHASAKQIQEALKDVCPQLQAFFRSHNRFSLQSLRQQCQNNDMTITDGEPMTMKEAYSTCDAFRNEVREYANNIKLAPKDKLKLNKFISYLEVTRSKLRETDNSQVAMVENKSKPTSLAEIKKEIEYIKYGVLLDSQGQQIQRSQSSTDVNQLALEVFMQMHKQSKDEPKITIPQLMGNRGMQH